MLLQLMKKLSGSCQIRIFTLSQILTAVELSLFFLVFVFMLGVQLGHYHFGIPIGTKYSYFVDLSIIVCLVLELVGLKKKIFGLIVFSCVYRILELLGCFSLIIGFCMMGYAYESEMITDPKFLALMQHGAW